MLTKNQIKFISNLKNKKHRQESGLFVVEGIKGVREFLDSNYELEQVYTLEVLDFLNQKNKVTQISEQELQKISTQITPNTCLGVFKMRQIKEVLIGGIQIALDGISDPGNLGTIIRLCDWFGVSDLICSENCVDVYNPKVVQASMGSLARVQVVYKNLLEFLPNVKVPVYGTFLEGESIYKAKLPKDAFIVLGNEANGISQEVKSLITHFITIPRFGALQQTESLNVATATAITLSEFKRND